MVLIDPSAPSTTDDLRPRGHQLYIPIVMVGQKPAPPPDRDCFGDVAAQTFYELLRSDARQQRPDLGCCPALVKAAGWRASRLAGGDNWGHVDSNGVWANAYARTAGCNLPADYPDDGNNIESLVAGSPNAAACIEALARSEGHADHLFGRNDFFRRQGQIGIAVAKGGVLGWYWVIMIGICEASSGE